MSEEMKNENGDTIFCENWLCETPAVKTRARQRTDGAGEIEINLCACCAEAWDMANTVSPEIIITVEGGLVQNVDKNRDDISVSIKDYDVQEEDGEGIQIKKDKNGDLFTESIW